jgi:WD40 repeat protein
LLATAEGTQKVRLWKVPSGDLARTIPLHIDTIYEVAFAPDGNTRYCRDCRRSP